MEPRLVMIGENLNDIKLPKGVNPF
jgi:hypothetical protein